MLYQRLGFHKDAINLMIGRYPLMVAPSEKKIAEMVGFLTDKAGLTRDDIVAFPTMMVRCLEVHSRRLLVLTKERFLDVYVRPHVEEVPDVLRAMNDEIPFQGWD
ncbi:hypothetical protein EJB05_35511, partial [Eragrostis curvula]